MAWSLARLRVDVDDLPVLVGLFVFAVERLLETNVWSAYGKLGFNPTRVKYPALTVYFCCLAGGFRYMFFDMLTHQSLPYVIYPAAYDNPFYLGQVSGAAETVAVSLAFFPSFCGGETRRGIGLREDKPKESKITSLITRAELMEKNLSLEETVWKTVALFNRLNSPQAVARAVTVTSGLVVVAFSGPFCYECGDIQKYIDAFAKDFKIFINYAELTSGKARETTPHNVEVSYLVKMH